MQVFQILHPTEAFLLAATIEPLKQQLHCPRIVLPEAAHVVADTKVVIVTDEFGV